jgi:phage terminase small subunit
MALTDRQKRFCDEYLVDLNATQAAIRAGYSHKRASEQAYQLLQKTTVQEYIQKRKADRIERVEITQDFVLAELKAIASVNATDYARIVEKNATALVDGVEIQLYDAEGNPVMYRTVEPILTDELTETQKKALAVIKKGRDGFEIRPYDKLKVLELMGKHLGMWDKKQDAEPEVQDDGFLDAIRGEVADVWQQE